MAAQLPLANLITLGARDFDALRESKRRVGCPQVMNDSEFAVFELGAILLAVFPLDKLARDGNTEPAPRSGGISVQRRHPRQHRRAGRQRRRGRPAY